MFSPSCQQREVSVEGFAAICTAEGVTDEEDPSTAFTLLSFRLKRTVFPS